MLEIVEIKAKQVGNVLISHDGMIGVDPGASQNVVVVRREAHFLVRQDRP